MLAGDKTPEGGKMLGLPQPSFRFHDLLHGFHPQRSLLRQGCRQIRPAFAGRIRTNSPGASISGSSSSVP